MLFLPLTHYTKLFMFRSVHAPSSPGKSFKNNKTIKMKLCKWKLTEDTI